MITLHFYNGMDETQLKTVLRSCFNSSEVVGLENNEGAVYPLSLILKNPTYFTNHKYAAVTKNQSALLEDSNQFNPDVYNRIESIYENESLIKLSDDRAFISDSPFLEFDGGPLTIGDAKEVLGLGHYSSEFIIDFLIEHIEIVGDDVDEDESSWLISEIQFETAMSQLLNRQRADLSIEQRAISEYLVHSVFSLFDDEGTGHCDLRELGCGLMLFSGGEIVDRAQMAYKLVAESDNEEETGNEGVNVDMMIIAIASVLKVVAILNSSYLQSCDPFDTAEEITKRAFIRAKLLLSEGCSIAQEDFEYWFAVVLSIYNETEEEDGVEEEEGGEYKEGSSPEEIELRLKREQKYVPSELQIDTESEKCDADVDYENGDCRETMPHTDVVLELRRAAELLGLTGVASEDLMELLGEISSEGMLSEESWQNYLYEFVVGDEEDQIQGVELGMKIFKAFDLYENSVVSYIDFCSGLSFLCDSPTEDKIMVAFVLNDRDTLGIISVNDFKNLVLACLRVVIACSSLAEDKLDSAGVELEELANLTVMEGLAVMELSYDDSLTLEIVSEIAFKCVAISAVL
jgi:Ca2+-binding EF-hand superfamily protein